MLSRHKSSDWIPTNDFAAALGVQGATARRSFCVKGHYMGQVPKKLPNGRLLWPKSGVDRLLDSQTESQAPESNEMPLA